MKEQYTKKQHYIPRMILKNFSFSNSNKNEKKFFVYQLDKNKKIERIVSVLDICYEKNLYEIKDENGQILERNLIEKGFSCLEESWNKIINKIIAKQRITEDDKNMLGLLLVMQIMRMPEFIDATSTWLYSAVKNTDNSLTKNEADKYTKLASFVWGEVKPETNWMLDIMLREILKDKSITIYHSNSKFILNGDSPVSFLNLDVPNNLSQVQWILPLTEHHCLGLLDKGNPLYIDIDSNMTNFVNHQIFHSGGNWIYSSFLISKDENLKKLINGE